MIDIFIIIVIEIMKCVSARSCSFLYRKYIILYTKLEVFTSANISVCGLLCAFLIYAPMIIFTIEWNVIGLILLDGLLINSFWDCEWLICGKCGAGKHCYDKQCQGYSAKQFLHTFFSFFSFGIYILFIVSTIIISFFF